MNIVTALQSEAEPVIQAFDLDGTDPAAPFQIYRNDELNLIVSGPGKTSAAAAVSFLGAVKQSFDRDEVWLNVGVAGHPEREIGEPVYAGKILDRETGEAWYPQPVYSVDPDLETVRTCSEPVRSFDEPLAHDMEAAGFYEAVLRFTTVERAHVLKVISDGNERTPDDVNREDVRELVSRQTEEIRSFLHAYRDMTDRDLYLDEVREVKDRITDRIHFTQAQKHQLQQRLERWKSVYPDRDVQEVLESVKDRADAILSALSSDVESAQVTLDASS